jgi:16S rRNA (guanine966-N2)-methyltransferase
MRIVAGIHRGRVLRATLGLSIRPTLDRVREAVFNILAHRLDWDGLAGARVLDVFAGSGACGLEALSRGAAHAVFIDRDAAALACIRRNAAALGEDARITLIQADATRLGPPPVAGTGGGFALAFLDPPYGAGLAAPALGALADHGWLEAGAIAVVETGCSEALTPPKPFVLRDQRTYGPARVRFLSLG